MGEQEPEYRLVHNPGYDFMRVTYWMEEAERENSNPGIAPYLLSTLGVVSACIAIEGYIDVVGRILDSDWNSYIQENLRFKDRLKRIYSKSVTTLDLGQGIWQDVIFMFKERNQLAHPTYVDKSETREDEIPTIFQEIAKKYPSSESRRIAEEAVSSLSNDFDMADLRRKWQFRFYSGPARY